MSTPLVFTPGASVREQAANLRNIADSLERSATTVRVYLTAGWMGGKPLLDYTEQAQWCRDYASWLETSAATMQHGTLV